MTCLTRRSLLATSGAALLPALPARAAAAEPVTLSVWSWLPNFQAELDMCQAANPGIKFQLTNAGQAGPEYAKLRTALKARAGAPDIVQLELDMVRSFAQVRGLADLKPFGARDMASLYVPYTWKEVTDGERINALPWDSGPMGQIYREDISKAHGFEPPKTWDEFADTARSLVKAAPGTFLTNATFSEGGWVTGLLWQAGWRPFAVDGDHITIRIKSDSSARFAAYWQKLIDAKAVDTSAGFTTDWYRSLAEGRYAVWLTAAWGPVFLQQFAQSSAGKWRAALLPQWDASKPTNGNYGGSALAITQTSPHKQEAATAIKWLLGQKAPAKEFASRQFLFPTLNSLLQDQGFLDTPFPFFGGQTVDRVFAQASTQVGTDFQWSPFNDYFIAQLGNEFGAAAGSGGSLEAVFDRLQSRVDGFANDQGFTVST